MIAAVSGSLYVGGRYYDTGAGRVMAGQAYVQYEIPAVRDKRYPIIMIPGGHGAGSRFSVTPDGRDGWSKYFLRQGYAVYLVDQPGRGRSVYHRDIHGDLEWISAEELSRDYTSPARHNLYPQAHLHTQWPGSGLPGDPVFDNYLASMLGKVVNRTVREEQNRDAGAALLDRIGPAILMTHSQSGTYGWLIADARPDLVKAIVAVEPGCPVGFITPQGPPDWFAYSGPKRRWGLADIPLTYDPVVSDPSELRFVLEEKASGPGLARCWRQEEPARKLRNLANVPVALVSSEASFHTAYDLGTANFLRQAGVNCDYMQLADHGIHGNGHSMMLESNSDEVATLIAGWLTAKVGP
jgi:pimeloyl-ACP methyl ester carboxylesterase